jgi:hypothetical protein
VQEQSPDLRPLFHLVLLRGFQETKNLWLSSRFKFFQTIKDNSMSKAADKIKSLLAEYEGRHPGALKLKPKSNKYHAKIVAHVKPARLSPPPRLESATASVSKSSSPKPEPSSSYEKLRPPPGLEWTTFKNPDGTTVPVLKVTGNGELDNYAAVKNTRPAGTYTIYKLEPRKAISYRGLAKDIRHHIEQDIKHEATVRENIAFTKRQEEARSEAEKQAFLNQPGFYIVPGETVGPDDKIYNADGPYQRFESAGFNPDFNELRGQAEVMAVEPNFNDVEDDALKAARSSPNNHVKIIEARNPLEAAAGRGHVWWQDGIFRGSPVDPRQRGFGF